MSPHGDWILFNCCFDALRWESMSLMRVRVDGGPAETVFPLISSPEPLTPFAVRNVQPPRCTQAPADLCAIAERRSGGKQLVFTSFDLVKGRGRELASYDIDPTASYKWDLSPDGTRIAVLKASGEHLHILSLANEGVSEITIKKWNTLETVDWSTDGKGLFISAPMNGHSSLLYTDLQGNARVLWDQASEQEGDTDIYAIPSPDGRRLAMYGWKINSNMWMLENF
jgi:Tol biopolymer transport system component